MFYKKIADGFLVRLERGDEVRAALSKLMREEEIGCGTVTGLGAVDDPRLGYYVLDEKRYIERRFAGEFELVGLNGTLAWYDGEPFPHVHVVLSDPEFATLGGHCFEATTAATVELHVHAESDRVDREQDAEIGLHLMSLPTSCPIRP